MSKKSGENNKEEEAEKLNKPLLGERKLHQVRYFEDLLLEIGHQQRDFYLDKLEVNFLDESDLHAGDYVLQLRNPDFKDVEEQGALSQLMQKSGVVHRAVDSTISLEQANLLVQECLMVESYERETNQLNQYLQYAFIRAFLKLPRSSAALIRKYETFVPPKRALQVPKSVSRSKKQSHVKLRFIDDEGFEQQVSRKEQRLLRGGKYLTKTSNDDWERSVLPVKDFETLLRNLLVLKLQLQGGFRVRQFLSREGQYIYLVLTSSYHNLQVQAHQDELNIELNLGQTDLWALEPLDNKFRPLRLNYQLYLDRDSKFKKTEGAQRSVASLPQPYNKRPPKDFVCPSKRVIEPETKFRICTLINQINFAQIGQQQRCLPIDPGQTIIDCEVLKMTTWVAYRDYLEFLKQRLDIVNTKYLNINKQIRKAFETKQNYNDFVHNGIHALDAREEYQLWTESQDKTNWADKDWLKDIMHQNEYMIKPHILKRLLIERRSKEIQEAFEYSLAEVQKKYPGQLKNLFQLVGLEERGSYAKFFSIRKQASKINKIYFSFIWKQQIVNERGKEDIFDKMTRIKLTYSLLKSIVSLLQLQLKYDFITKQFPLTDKFFLFGKSLEKYFTNFKSEEAVPTFVKDKFIERLKVTVKSRKNVFDEIKKIYSVEDNWTVLNSSPSALIRSYFGEKIALYFNFLRYYNFCIIPVAILSIPSYVINYVYDQSELIFKVNVFVFTFVVIIWSSWLTGSWKQKEKHFQLKFGQLEEAEDERPRAGFQGVYKRSIRSNRMNELEPIPYVTLKQSIISWTLIVMSIGINIAMIFGALRLQTYLQERNLKNGFPDGGYLQLDVLIPTASLYVILMPLDYLFIKIATRLTERENYKTRNEFEKAFIIKVFIYRVISALAYPLFIAFIMLQGYPWLGTCLKYDYGDPGQPFYIADCWENLDAFVRSYLIVHLIKQAVFEILIPFLRIAQLKIKELVQHQARPLYANSVYRKLNGFIEHESEKEDFSIHPDIDGTTFQYLELVTQFAILNTVGIIFELIFLYFLIMNVFKAIIDRIHIINSVKRPVPQNAATIGVFAFCFDVCSKGAIIIYPAIVVFSSKIFQLSDNGGKVQDGESSNALDIDPIVIYVIFVMAFFMIKYVMDKAFAGIGENTESQIERQKFIIQTQLFGVKNKTVQHQRRATPITKVFGSILEQELVAEKA